MALRGLVPVALALTACGPPQADEGFDATFRQSAMEACVRAATERGAEKTRIEPYCTCFVGQFDGLTAREKVALGADRAKIDAAAATCRAEVMDSP